MNPLIYIIVYLLTITHLWYAQGVKQRKMMPSYEEMTVVEDVLGTYELESIKNLISNSTSKLAKNMAILGKNFTESGKGKWSKELVNKALVIEETVDGLRSKVDGTKGYLEEVYDGIKSIFKSFKNQFIQSLSDLKLLVEHQSRQFQTVLGKTSLASQQLLASDCLDLYNLHYNASGTYWIQKFGQRILCDMETDGGGWLVIQRRAKVSEQEAPTIEYGFTTKDGYRIEKHYTGFLFNHLVDLMLLHFVDLTGSDLKMWVDFNQDWFTYKMGFGNLDTEFWIGNDVLHVLTNQKPYELRIEMQDFENETFYATYSHFRVGNEESNYLLDIGNYTGNVTDAFNYHHGLPFSTKDRDMDNYVDGNCAVYFSGGWWYDRCYDAHLNGIYPDPPDRDNASYISWWSRNKKMEKVPLVLTNVMIKIRPKMN